MKPDLKPSGHNSAFPFPNFCLLRNHFSNAPFVFTFANFRMYFLFSVCQPSIQAPTFQVNHFIPTLGYSERKTSVYHLEYAIKMTGKI